MDPSQTSLNTLNALRDGSLFKWYVIPMLVFVLYIYTQEIKKKDWSVVLAGLAFWGMDWFNEIWNGLLFHFTQFAPAWGVAMPSAYVILIGLNIEISFMFAIAGIVFVKTLPDDKNLKILGISNRLFLAMAFSVFCVIVEIFLNQCGALVWEWWWWNARVPWLIFLFGYLPFFVTAYIVYDMEDLKKQVRTVVGIFTLDAVCLVLFMWILKWI